MDVLHMISVLQVYIHIRKDKEVKIKPPSSARELFLLVKAYDYAVSWMEENNVKLKVLN